MDTPGIDKVIEMADWDSLLFKASDPINARAELSAIKAEVAALREDKERLDWLCEMDVEAAPIGDGFNVVLSYPCHDDDLREAIDAMKPAT